MTSGHMRDLVQQQLDAYNKRHLKDFCACYHPEVQVTNLITNKVTSSGMTEFEEKYRALFERYPLLNCTLKSRIVLETAVIDEEHVTGVPQFPDGIHAVAIYGFRDGLIDRVWFPQ